MEIKFIGVGSSFADGIESSIIISDNNQNILFDCGSTIFNTLKDNKFDFKTLNGVFISHNHFDHIGSLEKLLFYNYFINNTKTNLYSGPRVLEELWDDCLSGSMKYLKGKNVNLNEYANINIDNKFNIGRMFFEIVPTKHSVGYTDMPSNGIFIKKSKSCFITGDSVITDNLFEYYEKSNIIFQDCYFGNYDGAVHAQYHELIELDKSIKEKMYLYHYDLNIIGMTYDEADKFVKIDGFAGLVHENQSFQI